jgi:hypothetical protein
MSNAKCNHFKHIARGGLIDMSMVGATIACALTSPPVMREAFAGAAITAGFMVAYNAVWRFSPQGRRPETPGS